MQGAWAEVTLLLALLGGPQICSRGIEATPSLKQLLEPLSKYDAPPRKCASLTPCYLIAKTAQNNQSIKLKCCSAEQQTS